MSSSRDAGVGAGRRPGRDGEGPAASLPRVRSGGSDAVGAKGVFDHYARLVQRLLGVPTSLVTIVEEHRQVFPGAAGLAEPYHSERQTPLSHSFCQYVVRDRAPMVVADAREVERLADNPAIGELDVIAYAGWPLVDRDGRVVGSVCAIDSGPREWSGEEVAILEELAQACSAELQNARALAEEGEALARTIFDSVDVAMLFYETGGGLILANELARRFAETTGFDLDGPFRADNHGLVPPDPHVIARALRGELTSQETMWVGPSGNQIAVTVSSQQVFRPDGTSWGTLIAAHDITNLARSLQVRESFITTVAHELRTPLTSILGYVELLVDDVDGRGEDLERTARRIDEAATRLRDRITELLDTADRHRQLDLASTDLAALTRGLTDSFAAQARAADITLTTQAQHPEWAVVDEAGIEMVVRNLVSNAIKFTHPGGHIALTTTGQPDHVRITVTDDGVGMSPDEVAQACDMFWRAESSHRQALPGTGIGLALARDLIAAHHGSLDIDSTPDVGTTITLTLPRDPTRAAHSLPADPCCDP
ncbi:MULTISPECIES: ATP-binding protein [unclassified Nocardioides]|uniref:ATP-binding protein n=1 Tax=unclassified Nocardioides TaxID=2615069 RepID=UPI000056F73A|nr:MULTISPECIES: ATP-binding protein [unclassified Nocardioides]ABL82397.1 GAF sensor signal transduction histidine kinase [Nocardioides sp. JS614]